MVDTFEYSDQPQQGLDNYEYVAKRNSYSFGDSYDGGDTNDYDRKRGRKSSSSEFDGGFYPDGYYPNLHVPRHRGPHQGGPQRLPSHFQYPQQHPHPATLHRQNSNGYHHTSQSPNTHLDYDHDEFQKHQQQQQEQNMQQQQLKQEYYRSSSPHSEEEPAPPKTKKKTTRRGKKKISPTLPSTEEIQSCDNGKDKELMEYRNRRARNNEAAKKSRLKAKMRVQEMEDSNEVLAKDKLNAQARAKALEDANSLLMAELMEKRAQVKALEEANVILREELTGAVQNARPANCTCR